MNAVVTGASGFVGRVVARRLAAQGWRVTALVRRPGEVLGAARHCLVETLEDAAGLRSALDGADAVIHLAARVHVMPEGDSDPLPAYRRVNVDGTRCVRDVAIEMGVRRFVYLSSVKVHGEARAAPYRAEELLAPADPYGISKQEAEALFQEVEATRLGWTILRPPLVYGPEVGGNFRRLLRLASAACRWPLPLGGIDNLRSMIFVDNLADAIATILTNHAAQGRTFLVSDDHDVGVSELLRRLAVALGGRPRLFRAPLSLLRQVGSLMGREADLDRMLGTLRVDSSMIQTTLGWRPPVELDDALNRTAQWWRNAVAE